MNEQKGIHLLDQIPKKHEGWVYLLWAVGTTRYKIGRSANPVARHQTINKQSPYPTKILDCFWTVDALADEKFYHEVNADWRIHGEWFELKESEVNFVAKVETKLDSLTFFNFYKVPHNSYLFQTLVPTYSPTISQLFFHHNAVLEILIDSRTMRNIYFHLRKFYAAAKSRDDLIYIDYIVGHVISKKIQVQNENISELLTGLLIGARFRLIDLQTIHEEYFQ